MGNLFRGYVFDTSALIDLWRRRYPPDVFRTLWLKIEEMIASGEILAPQEVLNELQRQHDDLYIWAKKQKCFRELDEEQIEYVKRILKDFPSLVDVRKTVPDADPFVIALAKANGWKVVSSENPGGASPRRHIPDACKSYGVECLSLLEFFRDRQWSF
jgi:hypothetical protein